MRVLVTGAAGRLGLAAGNALAAAGHDVVGADWRPHAAARFPIVTGDLRRPGAVAELVRGVGAVAHFAAYASGRLEAPGGVAAENAALDALVLDAAATAGVRLTIFASSIRVFSGAAPAWLPLDGTMPAAPADDYGRAKRATEERMMRLAAAAPERAFVAVRFPWVIAPEERAAATRRDAALANRAEAFAFLPVEEVGRLVVALAVAERRGYRCYFAAARENLLGAPAEQVWREHFPGVAWRGPAGKIDSLMDHAAIAAETGWRPEPVAWARPRLRGWERVAATTAMKRLRSRTRRSWRELRWAAVEARATGYATAEARPEVRAGFGEGPVWDERAQRLLWVDVAAGALHRFDPETGRDEALAIAGGASAVVPTGDGRALVVQRESLAWVDLASGATEPHPAGRFEGAPNRLNDAKADARGRLWVGSGPQQGKARTGTLFRVDPDGTVTRHVEGLGLANGLGWSPDGGTFYLVDSGEGAVSAFVFDEERGTLAGRRELARFAAWQGVPDGLWVDRAGGVWVALLGAGRVVRLDPRDGRIAGWVRVPVPSVTAGCFGGAERDCLFLTTARDALDPVQQARQPLAGCLFVARPGMTG